MARTVESFVHEAMELTQRALLEAENMAMHHEPDQVNKYQGLVDMSDMLDGWLRRYCSCLECDWFRVRFNRAGKRVADEA